MRALCQSFAFLVAYTCIPIPVYALFVRFDIPDESFPPNISRSIQDTPIQFTLQLHNDSTSPAVILLWQLHLEITADASATGQLSFDSVSAAANPLFEPPSEPGPPIDSLATSVVISDADLVTFAGTTIPPGEARNIALLTLTASPDAQGLFDLSIRDDMIDLDASSYWFTGDGPPEPLPFSNFSGLRSMEPAKLAGIQWLNVPEPTVYVQSGLVMLFGMLQRRRSIRTVRTFA